MNSEKQMYYICTKVVLFLIECPKMLKEVEQLIAIY